MPNPVYLLVAYGVFWALTFILATSIWVRQRRLDSEVSALKAMLGEERE